MEILRTASFFFLLFAAVTGQQEPEIPPERPSVEEGDGERLATIDPKPSLIPLPELPELSPLEDRRELNTDDEQIPLEITIRQPPTEELYLESPSPQDNDHSAAESGPMFETTNERAPEADEQDLLAALEIAECAEVTCRTPFRERVRSWMCEYTKYTVETLTWIERFDEWWSGCEESDQTGASEPAHSMSCPDNDLVKCSTAGKKMCANDRMGCTRCICADGKYKDSTALFKVWRKEMTAFKARFETYKSKVDTCTRVVADTECDVEDPADGSGSGDEPNGPDVPGSGDESGSGSGDERDIDVGSGDNTDNGSGDLTDSTSGSGSGGEIDDRGLSGSGEDSQDSSGGSSTEGSGSQGDDQPTTTDNSIGFSTTTLPGSQPSQTSPGENEDQGMTSEGNTASSMSMSPTGGSGNVQTNPSGSQQPQI